MKWITMPQDDAEQVIKWKYPHPYSFYDMTADEEDFQEFIDPESRGKHTYSVYENDQLIGLFCATPIGNQTVVLGLGLHPNLTGKGYGQSYIEQGIQFVKDTYGPVVFHLSVAAFNERAIQVYERIGFKKVTTFMQATNGGEYEFVKMEKS